MCGCSLTDARYEHDGAVTIGDLLNIIDAWGCPSR
jgi:hypothetical protein